MTENLAVQLSLQLYLYDGSRAISQGLDRLLPNGGGGATTPLQIRQGSQVQLAISMSSGKDAQGVAYNQAPTGRGGSQHKQKAQMCRKVFCDSASWCRIFYSSGNCTGESCDGRRKPCHCVPTWRKTSISTDCVLEQTIQQFALNSKSITSKLKGTLMRDCLQGSCNSVTYITLDAEMSDIALYKLSFWPAQQVIKP